MSLKVGDLFATLTLQDADFTASLNAALASLEQAQANAQLLTQPPAPQLGQITAQLELCVSAARQAGVRMNEAAAQAFAGAGALTSAAAALGAQVRPVLQGSLRTAGVASGQALGNGLVQGINSKRGAVAAAAARLARAAVAAVRSAIREGSPSKVMQLSGGYFAQGFANGITGSAHLARSAARDLADTAVIAAGSNAPRAQGPIRTAAPQAIDYDRLAAAMAQLQMSLTLDGRSLAQLSAEETALAQRRREQSAALGYYGILRNAGSP